MNDAIHDLVRDGFVRYGRDGYAFEARKAGLAAPCGYREDAWRDFAELGWLALRLPEALGGLDADAAMVGAMMETVGRHLLLEPLLASAVLGAGALRYAPDDVQADILPGLAAGTTIVALVHQGKLILAGNALTGEAVGVLHGDVADQFVVALESGLMLVGAAAPGVSRQGYRLVDGRGAAIVRFDAAPMYRIGGPVAFREVMDHQTVALCGEAFGSADRLVAATADYLKVRRQFGQALGSYQALQHRMSEMAMLREEIGALTRAARGALAGPVAGRSRIVSGAAAYVLGAARAIANDAVQLHGGMGITEDLDISHHFRRQMVIAAMLGGRDAQIERFTAAATDVHAAEQAA